MRRPSLSGSWLYFLIPATGVLATVIGIACGGDYVPTGVGTGTVRQCSVTLNSQFPQSGSVTRDAPTECPFHIGGLTDVDFALTATVAAGSVVADQFVLTLADWQGRTWSANVQTTWNVDGNPWTIVVSGDYPAGHGGFDGHNNGYDTMYAQFYTSPGPNPQAVATITLSYTFGSASVGFTAPDSIGSGVPFSAHASITDVNYLPPVSYQWTVDGSPVGNNSADIALHGPDSGSSMTVSVTTTDANGVQHSDSHMVTACGNNQITC